MDASDLELPCQSDIRQLQLMEYLNARQEVESKIFAPEFYDEDRLDWNR